MTTTQKKDKKITIITATWTEDEMGQRIPEWEPLHSAENIWAYYRQASADEFFGAAAIKYKVEAIFKIRWRNDIDTTMKVRFRGIDYGITRIDDFEGNKQDLVIYAYVIK
ncbi:hypothetical protein IGM_05164 [Bacillus cereus HuB4-4]|uniref:Phage head-tail adaptor n=1 Tax=Bacillus cereus HuB4-4 TaxID=1053211 RepID=A0A9W5QQS8_BACCE|nr:phage head closure protein [Bacillus cereus]EOP82969.1 hypothetical protein IGM_05164 [Bacillus cereus HuB4-4]